MGMAMGMGMRMGPNFEFIPRFCVRVRQTTTLSIRAANTNKHPTLATFYLHWDQWKIAMKKIIGLKQLQDRSYIYICKAEKLPEPEPLQSKRE